MGQDGSDHTAEIAKLLAAQAEKAPRAGHDATPNTAWRWSRNGWSADHERSVQSLDAVSDTKIGDAEKD